MLSRKFPINLLLILSFTALGFVVMGYHPGAEDDGVYLSAVKSDLNPALYPHDSEFFRLQLQASVFDKAVASFVQLTHVPVSTTELLWQLASIGLILFACWRIARHLFQEQSAHWSGVAMVAAMFTLPVAGTALFLVDPHLHARTIATALILIAVPRIMAGRFWSSLPLLFLAFLMHPIMGAMGISFSCFLALAFSEPVHARLLAWNSAGRPATLAATIPLGWVLQPPTLEWRKALDTRTYYYLYKWHWYEWLGALAPLLLFWLLWQWARKRNETVLARFALAIFAYGIFQQALAMLMLASPALVRLTPLQPMRYLHLVYVFLSLVAGCLLGKYFLKSSVWRWAIFLLVFNGSMFAAQRAQFSSSQQIEWPGRSPSNPWIQAFAWIRNNTPADAYFALDPGYLAVPGEDYHSFRALAERSQLADKIKDASVVTQVPDLGTDWDRQVQAQRGWTTFRLEDFERLKSEFGVNWVLVANPPADGLDCRWHNETLAVCRIP